MPAVVQMVSLAGVDPLLRELIHSSQANVPRDELETRLSELGSETPASTFDQLVDAKLLQSIGGGFGISLQGHRTALLLEALSGGNVEEIFQRIKSLTGAPETYELVRQGMTTKFFRSLLSRPGFGRIFICSPWVNPTDEDAATLKYAFLQLSRRGGPKPEVHVLTRPMDMQYDRTGDSLNPFRDIGATIYEHSRLHSKLYIREPGVNGGTLMAMVGSENLTRGNNLELGIQINGDDRLVNQLIEHFWELTSYE